MRNIIMKISRMLLVLFVISQIGCALDGSIEDTSKKKTDSTSGGNTDAGVSPIYGFVSGSTYNQTTSGGYKVSTSVGDYIGMSGSQGTNSVYQKVNGYTVITTVNGNIMSYLAEE